MQQLKGVYRFKLADNVASELSRFAVLHAYDDRTEYKKHWHVWLADNSELVAAEAKRLAAAGYTGDCTDKLYKAGRYYFRKKSLTTPPPPKERCVYVGTSRDLLLAMDEFIALARQENTKAAPASLYDQFMSSADYQPLMERETFRLRELTGASKEHTATKLKKTFKNRHYTKNRRAS